LIFHDQGKILLERLKQMEEKRIRLKEEIEVKDLWELVQDEDESF